MIGGNTGGVLRWITIQRAIAGCHDCIRGKPDLVAKPLGVGEIPDPPSTLDVLFVGVAPPALKGKHRGRHFWSNASDPLRIGLFGVLDEFLGSQLRALNRRNKVAADDAFCDRKLFFVHSCKVRPIPADLKAPPDDVIASCARLHLVEEIVALQPRAVCFLGHNTATAAALLGLTTDDRIATAKLMSVSGDWNGLAMATVQPIRGAEKRAGPAISRLVAKARVLER